MKYPGIFSKLMIGVIILTCSSCKIHHAEIKPEKTPADSNYLILSESQIQLANIEVSRVLHGTISKKLFLTGVLRTNERNSFIISSRIPGRIIKLYFKNAGDQVNVGDKLYEYYSDELVTIQKEYLTIQSNNWNFTGRYEPSLDLEKKLLASGFTDEMIDRLANDRKIRYTTTIYSPFKGLIRSVNVSEGEYLENGTLIYEFADDAKLWVEALAYAEDLSLLKENMPLIVIFPATGIAPVSSSIDLIYPSADEGRNTSFVRSVIDNPGRKLHPGMMALLYLRPHITDGLLIPSKAIIEGNDGNRVWIREKGGRFSCRLVVTGMQSDRYTHIVSGLESSDMVVTSGAYLINSEYILKYGSPAPGNDPKYREKNILGNISKY